MSLEFQIDKETVLRLIEHQHAEEIVKVVVSNLPHLARWLPWATDSYGIDDARQWIDAVTEDLGGRKQLALSIVHRDSLVGGIGWTDRKNVNIASQGLTASSADVGYWLTQDAQGQGITTRCVRKLLDYGFREVGFHRITIRAEPQNIRSCAVAERLGFQYEGTLRHVCRWNDRWVDHRCYSMLPEEWR